LELRVGRPLRDQFSFSLSECNKNQIGSVSNDIIAVGISLCRDKNQARLNLESVTCKDECITVLRNVGNQ